MAELTGDNTPLPQINEALPLSGSQVIGAGNTSTTFTISLGSLAPAGGGNPYDAKSATVVIANLGTAVTINAATLSFLDTVDTESAEIDYVLPSVSIASGANQTFSVALSSGILKNAQLSLTFASAPVAGSVGIEAIFQSAGSALSSANVAQVNGVTTAVGNGTTNTGTQRMTLASDSTGQVKLATGSNTIGNLTANQSVNIAQIGGTNVPAPADSVAFAGTTPAVRMEQSGTGVASVKRMITKFIQLQAQAITHATPVDVYTPTSGKKFRILSYHLSTTVAGAIQFEDGTGVEVLRTPLLVANTPTASPEMGNGILSGAVNTHLFLDVTVTGNISGWIGICEE